MNKQPEALRLADLLDEKWHRWKDDPTDELKAAAELRRLHAENVQMLAALRACDEAMTYMSEYDIPLTLPAQVKAAIAEATGE